MDWFQGIRVRGIASTGAEEHVVDEEKHPKVYSPAGLVEIYSADMLFVAEEYMLLP